MNAINPWLFLIPVAGLLTLVLLWWFYGIGREIQAERARESFRLQHERLEKLFFEKAASTGLPRGLRWLSCTLAPDVEFVREKKTRLIVALAPAVVLFEAIEGGDMEGLPAVPHPRHGSAVLHFLQGEWTTTGKLVFNLAPPEVIEHFSRDYERLTKRA